MIDVQYLFNEYRVAQSSVIELSNSKPYQIKQLTQKLVSNRLIPEPYSINTGTFYTESEFIALAKHLNISSADYESVMTAFQYARDLNR